jgi:GAF domain-containing protein
MSLVGRLEDLALSDIFQIIALSKKTGTLVLKSKAGAAVVVFKNGQVIQAATDNLRDTLGNILISKGLVSEQELASALEIQKSFKGAKRLGQILVEQGALSQELLVDTIRSQIENMIYTLLSWEEGFFNFDLGEVAPSDKIEVVTQEFLLKSGINPEYLLMESARVMDERKRDGKEVKKAGPGTPVRQAVSEFSEFLEEEGMTPRRPAPGEENAASGRTHELATLKAMFEELRFPTATAEITLLVLRYASELVNRAVLFMVTREEVRGLGQFGIELKEGSAAQKVRQIRVPVSETSIFSDVIRDQRSRIGSFSDSAWDTYLVKELGGEEPQAFFLVPMVSNGRVAAILYGDDLPDNKPIPAIAGLEIFVHQAGIAMEKALLERRITELEKQKANN